MTSITATQVLSVYRFDIQDPLAMDSTTPLKSPTLLSSLKSHTIWPPLALSLRTRGHDGVVASIAYSFPTYTSGWSAGVQELHITADGEVADSRLASAVGQGFASLAQYTPPSTPAQTPQPTTPAAPPTALSYSHPYLLLAHADNTLTLFLVTSTAAALAVGPGRRLWGHTSAVGGAHVGRTGKAVSVAARGAEVRVWELEGGFAAGGGRGRRRAAQCRAQRAGHGSGRRAGVDGIRGWRWGGVGRGR